MKNSKIIIILCVVLFMGTGCSDVLEKYPLDKPAQETFYTNATEIKNGINACYRFLQVENSSNGAYLFPIVLDCMTDIGFPRNDDYEQKYIARGEHTATTGIMNTAYNRPYMGIGRCNTMLQVIDEKASLLSDAQIRQYRGEALFLRAYYYTNLVTHFGDVPLVVAPVSTVSEAMSTMRTPKEQVIEQIFADYTEAAGLLEPSYSGVDKGRATSGMANAFKARAALYFGNFDIAATAAKTVMDSKVYDLYPSYENLFLPAGLWDTNNKELILIREWSPEISEYQTIPRWCLTRNLNGYVGMVPSQSMIDSYHCIDGKNIAESPLFDKTKPFENRDPRMKHSFVIPGERFGNFQYETHYDSTTCYNYETGTRVTNNDCYQVNQFTSFTGYGLKKHVDPSYFDRYDRADYPMILCRYGEVLLTYAEAKIELNQIDQSVVDVINSLRRDRDDVKMPEYTLADFSDQQTARLKVRHERKIELAFEGFRYADLRRWEGWALKYGNVPVHGRPFMGSYSDWPTVTFDENGEPQYPGHENYVGHPSQDYRLLEYRLFIAGKHELWPIPERELLLNPALRQNPGY